MDKDENVLLEPLSWNAIRSRFIHQLVTGVALLCGLILPTTLWRVYQTQAANFLIGSTVMFMMLLIFLYRKKISDELLASCIIGLVIINTVIDIFLSGILSLGLVYFIFSVFLIGLLFSARHAIVYCIIFSIFTALIAAGFISGQLTTNQNFDYFLKSPSVWAIRVLITIGGALVLITAIRKLQSALRTQVRHLRAQKNRIQVQNQEIAAKNERIEYLANHDALTELPTLRLANENFEMALRLARRNKTISAVLFLDLDGFKQINDIYGHDAGDKILKDVAKRLPEQLRESDTACRIGGDEFLIVLTEVGTSKDVEDVCQRLIKSVSVPFLFEDRILSVGVSIGGALYPEHGDTTKILQKTADAAMYRVKKSGKNGYQLGFADEAENEV